MTSDTTKNIEIENILPQVLAVAFIASMIFYYSFNHKAGSSMTEESVANQQAADDLINEKCIKDTSNVYRTECAIELLDRKAAEREWKQRKIETWKHENMYDLMDFEGSQNKIAVWREGFEKARDAWCAATKSTFFWGSALPFSVAECELSFELRAIDDLNFLYYDWIKQHKYSGDDIIGFEPTKADIDALVKTNTTFRGCVWAGEEDCENATSPILLNTKY